MVSRTRQLICSSDGLVHIVMKRKTIEYFRIVATLLFSTVRLHKTLTLQASYRPSCSDLRSLFN